MCNHEMTTTIHIREVRVCKRCQGGAGISWYRFDKYVERWLESQNGMFVNFTDDEYSNLERLALRRGVSIQTILRRFAASCQPNGGEWVHPSKGKKHGTQS